MEESYRETEELCRIAEPCGIDPNAVLDDIAHSIEIANKAAYTSRHDPLTLFFSKSWVAFLEAYFLKCQRRWLAKCGSTTDYQSMEKLWLESFEPLWLFGCNIAKDVVLNNVKKVSPMFAENHPSLSKTGRESLQAFGDEYVSELDRAFSQGIITFKEKQRQIVAKNLKRLAKYDKASSLEKLRHLMFE